MELLHHGIIKRKGERVFMIKKEIKWSVVILVTIGFVLFLSLALPRVSAYTTKTIGGFDSPDTSFLYSAEDMYTMANNYSDSGRSTYVFLRWTFDVIWPLVYTAFLVVWTVKLSVYVKGKNWIQSLYFLPILAMALDFLENMGASIVMFRYPATSGIIAHLTPIATLLKWTTLSVSFLLLLLLSLVILYQNVMKKT